MGKRLVVRQIPSCDDHFIPHLFEFFDEVVLKVTDAAIPDELFKCLCG